MIQPCVIGVTGTIGSGKTTVCAFFHELGAAVIDADAIGREVVEKDRDIFLALVTAFGSKMLNEDGTLNRRQLGYLAFADPEKKKKLNAIVHPALLKRLREEISKARQAGPVVVDAALILEWGIQSELDALIVVTADQEMQRERVMAQRGWSPQEVNIRMQAQIPAEKQVAHANYVIVNDGTIGDLRKQVVTIWERLLAEKG